MKRFAPTEHTLGPKPSVYFLSPNLVSEKPRAEGKKLDAKVPEIHWVISLSLLSLNIV